MQPRPTYHVTQQIPMHLNTRGLCARELFLYDNIAVHLPKFKYAFTYQCTVQYSDEHWFIHQHTPSHPHKPCACHKRISSYDEHWNRFTWDWLHYRHPCARIYSSIHSIKWWDISTMPAKININTTHKDEANNAWFAMHRGLSAHPSMLELIILHFFCVFA